MPKTTEITTNGRNIGEITASVRIHMRNMVNNAIELGMDLIDAKEICGHGEWLPWLKSVGISSSTAANYMKIAREIPEGSRMASLPYSKMLALLAAPPEDREALAEAAESLSAAEIRRLTEERNRAAEAANSETARADQAEAAAKQYYDEIAGLKTKLQTAEHERHTARVDLTKQNEAYERQKKTIDKLHEEIADRDRALQNLKLELRGSIEKEEKLKADLLIAENNRIEVEKAPADYEALKQQRQELLEAAAEAEERANAAEAELDAIRAGEAKADAGRSLRIAVNTFMADCQMMPAHPDQLIRDREKVERSVKLMESWCAAMREALTLHPAEGAVV